MQTAEQLEVDIARSFPEMVPLDPSDRREGQRFEFALQQLIAPYSGNEMPRAADFAPVACHDISSGGLSFYWPRRPDFEYVVVALESRQASIRLIGRTTFCVQEGDHGYRIGCQFIKRLK